MFAKRSLGLLFGLSIGLSGADCKSPQPILGPIKLDGYQEKLEQTTTE